jgi:cyclic pyranopterin phosphate synthase
VAGGAQIARAVAPFTTLSCQMSDLSFTHLDPMGRARMVDVTPKEPTHRRAVARCKVFMQPETTAAVANREVKKGDVLAVARVAGIQAAKRTSDMIPLCHPLLVGAVNLNFEIGDDFIAVEANVDTVDRTGVEMEALHACAVAALTIYDMCKSADRGMVIGELALWEKTGGRSGVYRRAADSVEIDPVGDHNSTDVSDTVTNVVES